MSDSEILAEIVIIREQWPGGIGVARLVKQLSSKFPGVDSKRVRHLLDELRSQQRSAETKADVDAARSPPGQPKLHSSTNAHKGKARPKFGANGLGPSTKTPAQMAAIQKDVDARIQSGSEALRKQAEMQMLSKMLGYKNGSYALLADGKAQYEFGEMFWVTPGDDLENALLGRAKVESVLGHPEGVYFLYIQLKGRLREISGNECVSDEGLARQLHAEYGVNPMPLAQEIELNPQCPLGMKFVELLADISK